MYILYVLIAVGIIPSTHSTTSPTTDMSLFTPIVKIKTCPAVKTLPPQIPPTLTSPKISSCHLQIYILPQMQIFMWAHCLPAGVCWSICYNALVAMEGKTTTVWIKGLLTPPAFESNRYKIVNITIWSGLKLVMCVFLFVNK